VDPELAELARHGPLVAVDLDAATPWAVHIAAKPVNGWIPVTLKM
jgi:hypothetical protein